MTTETVRLLGKIRHAIGWHGTGVNDREQFYCEHCKATHLDAALIEHAPHCLIIEIVAHMAALEKSI